MANRTTYRPKLEIPTKPIGGSSGDFFYMDQIADVMDYSKTSFTDVINLSVDLFALMYKQSYIKRLQSTEEGQKYLKDCERYKVTEPDVEGLGKLQSKLERR